MDKQKEIDLLKKNLKKCREEVRRYKWQAKEYEKLAELWMKDYDRLKEKYEPLYFVVGDE